MVVGTVTLTTAALRMHSDYQPPEKHGPNQTNSTEKKENHTTQGRQNQKMVSAQLCQSSKEMLKSKYVCIEPSHLFIFTQGK